MHIGKKFLVFILGFCLPAMLLVYWGLGLWLEQKAAVIREQSISHELESIRAQYDANVKRLQRLSHIYAVPLNLIDVNLSALDPTWHDLTHAQGLHFFRYHKGELFAFGEYADIQLPQNLLQHLLSGPKEITGAVLLDGEPYLLSAIKIADASVVISRSFSSDELNRLGRPGLVAQIQLVEQSSVQRGGYLVPIPSLDGSKLALAVTFVPAGMVSITASPDLLVMAVLLLGLLVLALGSSWISRSLVAPLRAVMTQLGHIDPNASEYQPIEAAGCPEAIQFSQVSNQLLAEIFAQKERARIILEGITDAVLLTDREGKLVYFNPAATRLLSGEALAHGQQIEGVLGWEPKTVSNFMASIHQPRSNRRFRYHERLLQSTLSRIQDHQGQLQGALVALRNITAEERLKAELRRQAEEDPITGLPNRATFEARLDKVFLKSSSAAVCYLDLEQFKIINDSCGHLEGDRMLQMVARTLRSGIEYHEMLARLGGDEFGILLLGRSAHDVARLLKELQRQLSLLVLEHEGQCYRVGVSIGVAFARAPLPSLKELFKDADIACIAAKRKGANQIHFYDDKDKELSYERNAPKWAMRIAQAIQRQELELYFQPIHGLHGVNSRQRMEILLRIREEDGRLLPPAQFIASAERFKLMPEVDKAVISMTMQWLADRPELWHDHCLSINLSGNSLGVEGMETFIIDELSRTGAPSSCICFEITETSAIQNRHRALDMLRSLRKLGFSFAIDDFGSGFASYGYLRELPVDYVKIDGCFVRQLSSNAKDYAIVKSIHDVCAVMGIETVAEFVESQDIIEKLDEIGINYAQGYAIGRPKPLADYVGRPKLARLA